MRKKVELADKDKMQKKRSKKHEKNAATAFLLKCSLSIIAASMLIGNDQARCVHGFLPSRLQIASSTEQRLHEPVVAVAPLFLGGGEGYGDDGALSFDPDGVIARNNARMCVKQFLTQRSIQSFSFLLAECRDPHSGKWIEDFLGVKNLGNYHGSGAFNVTRYPTWESLLLDMMKQPNEKMIVSAKRRGRGHGGWSKNNPYLPERWVEFKIDIMPASLVQRLLSVREQLASEFIKDLDIVKMADDQIMTSYFARVKGLRDGEKTESATAFDRVSINILNNFTEFSGSGSSPFRRGNFDLIYSLCTQASTHRLLREMKEAGPDKEVSFNWLRQFYSDKVGEFFDGDQSFGRADDFIDSLLRTSPSLVKMNDGRTVGLTDPLRIAEQIIALRSNVAEEWKESMREVKEDHIELNKILFLVMMGKQVGEDAEIASNTENAGGFE